MAGIIKGAQYSLPFTIKADGTIVTNETVQGVRIALGNQVASWPDGALRYSSSDKTWRFPLTQKASYALRGTTVKYQVEVLISGDIFPSKTREITVDESIFRKEWDED